MEMDGLKSRQMAASSEAATAVFLLTSWVQWIYQPLPEGWIDVRGNDRATCLDYRQHVSGHDLVSVFMQDVSPLIVLPFSHGSKEKETFGI